MSIRFSPAVARVRSLPALLAALSLLLLTPVATASEQDPFESVNRSIYGFNQQADAWVLRPVAEAYQEYVPKPLRTGFGNFLGNLTDINSAGNLLLQGRIVSSAETAARFVVNSTLGLAGLLDVATPLGLDGETAGFGQTLGAWGVDAGPYLVLPLFGPSTVRNGAAFALEFAALSVPAQLDAQDAGLILGLGGAIDARAELLGLDQLMTGDEYIFMREAYLQTLKGDRARNAPRDDFSEFETDDVAAITVDF